MPSTNDYQQRLALARRRTVLSEGRRPVPVATINEAACRDCGMDPCTCEEDEDELAHKLPRESLDVMEVLAATDPHTFTFMAECAGLRVAAMRQHDPLVKDTMSEDIDALAAVISEDIMELDEGLDAYQSEIKEMAQDYGYVVSAH